MIEEIKPRPGFYKVENEELLYSRLVQAPEYTLVAENHDTYDLPIDGWSWFEDETSARKALGLES